MRIVIVGRPEDRERLRHALAGTSVEILDEAASLSAARAGDTIPDAYLVAESASAQVRDPDRPTEALTRREIDVLELLADGLPNKVIASRLGISDQTVKFHVASITGKLGTANRTEAVRVAIRRGLVTI